MSYPCSKPHFIADVLGGHAAIWSGDDSAANAQSENRAIEASLKSVPLPDGLMTRLGMLAYTVPDESADHVDYLGC